MDTIKMLANSQGFYGRLYRSIMELSEDKYEELKEVLEAQNFGDAVDMVLFFES